MHIAIIGAGSVGGTLGTRWASAGHRVVFGVRDTSDAKVADLLSRAGANASAASPAQAAASANVVLLAVPWEAAQQAISSLGDLTGKTLLDATNPLKAALAGLTHGHEESGAEVIAEWATGANIVKIFNSTGFENMADPHYPDGPAVMLYCGDNAEARATAGQLAADLGFDPVDAGPLSQARLLEPFAFLWITLAYRQGLGRNVAFRLMRR